MKKIAAILFGSVFVASSLGFAWIENDDEEKKPKYTIKKIMGKAFKGKMAILPKVVSGKATEQEKKQALEYLKELAKNKPKKGDAESWKKKTTAIVKAMESVIKGDEGSSAVLKKAMDCSACHKAHK